MARAQVLIPNTRSRNNDRPPRIHCRVITMAAIYDVVHALIHRTRAERLAGASGADQQRLQKDAQGKEETAENGNPPGTTGGPQQRGDTTPREGDPTRRRGAAPTLCSIKNGEANASHATTIQNHKDNAP